ncbi:peptide ABC transporter substrate-binding protein [Virgibacillus halodenitrificans]|nr:peptide ABC transporter substrate-binding protein [Virgibacillus halodenitrificans]
MMKKLIAILILTGVMILGACSDKSATSSEPPKQDLVLNLSSEPSSLDPGITTSLKDGWVMEHLFEGLYTLDQEGEVVLGVAEKVDKSTDGLVYTFTIRKDAKWSDGSDVTAHDFEYAWKRALDPNVGARYASFLYVIKNAEAFNTGKASLEEVGVTALDDKTLKLTLEAPTPYLEKLMTITTFYPVKKEVVEANENWTLDPSLYVTNGAFQLNKWEHDSQLELIKNKEYYAKDEVSLEKITFKMINDATTAYQMYETGELDFISTIPTDQLEAAKQKPEYIEFPTYSTAMYLFNIRKEPFNNQKVRKAFAMGIDRKALVENVGKIGETPAFAMVPPGAETPEGDFREVGGNYFEEDYEEAKKLIAEAMEEEGWSTFPKVELIYSTSENNKRYSEAIQEMLKKNLDIDIQLGTQEWSSYLDTLGRKDYQMARMAQSGVYIDPAVNLEYFLGSGTNNRTGWINENYDQLLKKARVEQDETKRYELLHQAEEILMEDLPFMPYYFLSSNYLASPEIKGIVYYNHQPPVFKWAKK